MKLINEQINPNFVIQAKKLAKFTRLLQQILPVECLSHVKVANIRDQNLMLITDSPVWTTRLRQLNPQILQFIREQAENDDTDNSPLIHHIQISTRYNVSNDQKQKNLNKANVNKARRDKLQISESTATLLTQSANSMTHPLLKTSLLKIARHAKPSDDKTS